MEIEQWIQKYLDITAMYLAVLSHLQSSLLVNNILTTKKKKKKICVTGNVQPKT